MAGLISANETLYRSVQKLIESRQPHVLVILVAVKGSAPQDVGAKIIITAQGIHSGTVGGGKVEAKVIEQAQEMLQTETKHQLQTWNLQTDVGMTCGGEVRFFFEAFCVDVWDICIFGAGHVAQALIPILCQLPCQVHCIDSRQEWLDRFEAKGNLTLHCISEPEEAAAIIPVGAFVAMMTKGHGTDVPILKKILASGIQYPYLGMIGSKTKAFRVRKDLLRVGFLEEEIGVIRSPIGLAIGSNHPVEIGISIAAEMLSVRDSLA